MRISKGLIFLGFAFCLIFAVTANLSFACTDFQIKSTDGSIVIGRSMEFAQEMGSRICVHARGEEGYSESSEGKKEFTWRNKYGYISIDAFGLEYVVVDGINEEGLSFGALWLPGTQYQSVSEKERAKAINVGQVGAWILGSFKETDEVKRAIKEVRVWCDVVPEINKVPPLHFAIHDAKGNNIVIEFIEGEVKIYDNPIGVMTNAPPFEWHIDNLRNYINLDCLNSGPQTIRGVVLMPTGSGSGMHGIPGDWTPASRFVRAALFMHFANPVKNAQEGVNLAAHILNSVDIPYGDIKTGTEGPQIDDYTQWTVIKDLTNKVLYVRDYNNLSLRSVDLKKLKFEPGTKTKLIPLMEEDSRITDITEKFLQ